MINMIYNEKGEIRYLNVLKTAIVLSILLAIYMWVSKSIQLPWEILNYVLCFLILVVTFGLLHTSIIEVKKLLNSIILKLRHDYHIVYEFEEIQEYDNQEILYHLPSKIILLCVFRC